MFEEGQRIRHDYLGGGTIDHQRTTGTAMSFWVVRWDNGTVTTCPEYQLQPAPKLPFHDQTMNDLDALMSSFERT